MTSPSAESANQPARKFTGRKALLWLVGFFLVVFTANGVMAYVALGTWGGLDTRDAYRKGIHYNDQIAAAEAQKRSGWTVRLRHRPATLRGDRIDVAVSWPDRDLPPAAVAALISRPVTNVHDRKIILTKSAENIYTAPVELPEAGQWNVTILVSRPDGPIYQHRQKIFIAAED